MLPALLEYGASWLHFVALLLCGGALVGRGVLARAVADTGASELADRVRRSADRALRVAALLAVPAFGAILARQLVGFRDPFVPLGEDLRLLMGTDWGAAWRWAGGAGLVAALAVGAAGGTRTGRWIGAGALVATGVYPALTGHAAATEPRTLAIALDVAHVWAASAWIGGLGLLVLALRHASSSGGDAGERTTVLVGAFSPVALIAVAVLAGSGVWASLQHLDGPMDLIASGWGRVLAVKLGLVGATLALGFHNWRRLTPRLGRPGGRADMRRSAGAEFVLGNLVLIATTVLIRTGMG